MARDGLACIACGSGCVTKVQGGIVTPVTRSFPSIQPTQETGACRDDDAESDPVDKLVKLVSTNYVVC